jgi:hypothetical protein
MKLTKKKIKNNTPIDNKFNKYICFIFYLDKKGVNIVDEGYGLRCCSGDYIWRRYSIPEVYVNLFAK